MPEDKTKVVSILSYIFFIGIIWYFVDKKVQNSDTNFHVKQALNLSIISLIGNAILGVIPIIGWVLIPVFGLVMTILWIIGIVRAINNNKKELPIIGKYAGKYLNF
ncbi:MAG: DUF4870 domain-containing protein [Candidatus Woesearchaeota archaeon]